MSVVVHKESMLEKRPGKKEVDEDLINRLPLELLVMILRYVPPEYLYTLPRWCKQWRLLQKDPFMVNRERRHRWSVSPPPELRPLLHLKSMVLVNNCTPFTKLRLFKDRLFLSDECRLWEVSTTQRAREAENSQMFEDEELGVEEQLYIVRNINYIKMLYAIDKKGSVYYFDFDVEGRVKHNFILKYNGGVQTKLDFPDRGTDHVGAIVTAGSKLYVLCGGKICVWDNDKRVDTINVESNATRMVVERNALYYITCAEGECWMFDMDTRKVTKHEIWSLLGGNDFIDICVKDGDIYLYSEHENGSGLYAAIMKYVPSRNALHTTKHVPLRKRTQNSYRPNMGITGHYLYVTTTQNSLIIVDLRDFSSKHMQDIYNAVIGDDSSLYMNCADTGPNGFSNSRVLKFYWE